MHRTRSLLLALTVAGASPWLSCGGSDERGATPTGFCWPTPKHVFLGNIWGSEAGLRYGGLYFSKCEPVRFANGTEDRIAFDAEVPKGWHRCLGPELPALGPHEEYFTRWPSESIYPPAALDVLPQTCLICARSTSDPAKTACLSISPWAGAYGGDICATGASSGTPFCDLR